MRLREWLRSTRAWSRSTRFLVLCAAAVILMAALCAAYAAVFLPVPGPEIYTLIIPVAGPIGAVPVVLFAAWFGFKPQPRTEAVVVGIIYGAGVLLLGTIGIIQNAVYLSTVTIPPGEPNVFEPDALDLFLVSMPGALAILVAGVLALIRRQHTKVTAGRAAQG